MADRVGFGLAWYGTMKLNYFNKTGLISETEL